MESHPSAWHDRQVARAADAWLSCPDDTTAYARLVQAVKDRRTVLNPQLPGMKDHTLVVEPAPSQEPDVLDAVGADRPPEPISDILPAGGDPRAVLDRLRGRG